MSRLKDRFSLKNQVSVLAFFALLMVTVFGGLNIRDNIETSKILSEQEKLLTIKDTLTKIEREALSARLDEVQMLGNRDAESFNRFLERMENVKQLSTSLLEETKNDPDLSSNFVSELEVTLIHTLKRYENSVRRTALIGQRIGYRPEQGLMLKIETVRDELVLLLDELGEQQSQMEFARIQLQERDFLNTLDMGISDELMRDLERFGAVILDSDIGIDNQSTLNTLIQEYKILVNQSISNVVELELAQAANTLQFERITPEISKSQLKLDGSLSALQLELVEQRQLSALQTTILFCGSFLIILTFIVIQIRDNHSLVRRLRQLSDRMNDVALGQFPDVKDLPKGKDEIGILVQAFMAMASQIQIQIETIEQERQKADVASQAKSVFLANMSHELRTPLNAILGFAQIMQYEIPRGHQHHDYLNIINNSGEHLLTLINDVLEISKVESGKFTLKPVAFELDQLLAMVQGLLQTKAQQKGLVLSLTRSPEIPNYLFADEAKLRQILINLLGNGVKFTEAGSVRLTITGAPIACEQRLAADHASNNQGVSNPLNPHVTQLQPWQLTFEVADTGPGIASEDFDLLFEAFSQTALGQTVQEGTGLGLTISRRFVQLMGGDLTVKSQLGAGATFQFEIQVEQQALATSVLPDALVVPKQEIIGLASSQPIPRILVVEDQDKTRLLLQDLLTAVGFKARVVCNGQTAIEIWQTWQPDLILMNIQMPGINGYEAVNQIRALERSQLQPSTKPSLSEKSLASRSLTSRAPRSRAPASEHQLSQSLNGCPVSAVQVPQSALSEQPVTKPVTKIVALTANAFDGQRQEILSSGYDDFVNKPINRNALLDLIGRHLNLQFVYGDVEAVSASMQANLLSQGVTAMPVPWLKQLHQASLQGDDGAVLSLVRQISLDEPAHSVMISALTQWAESYKFENILILTEEALPKLASLEGGADGKP